jgi:TonB family protein
MPAMIATENPTVVLKISIDEKGKPIHPEIVSSSGSDAIDQPIRVAAYDWWTEPTHNKAGKPVPDVLLFTVRIK